MFRRSRLLNYREREGRRKPVIIASSQGWPSLYILELEDSSVLIRGSVTLWLQNVDSRIGQNTRIEQYARIGQNTCNGQYTRVRQNKHSATSKCIKPAHATLGTLLVSVGTVAAKQSAWRRLRAYPVWVRKKPITSIISLPKYV